MDKLSSNLKLRKILSDLTLTLYTVNYFIFRKSPTTIIKRKFISKIGKVFACKTVVESGTYFGQSTQYLSNHFDEVFSIELSNELFIFSKKRFSNKANVFLFHGDSAVQLPKILSLLSQPTVFYLDAHASGGVTQHGKEPSPVRIELEVISQFKFLNKSVILLDDAKGFDGSNSYPSFLEVCKWAEKNSLSIPYVKLDMIIIEPFKKI